MSDDLYAPLPLSVLRRTDLPSGAKLIYARLKLYTGSNPDAYPSVTTLADDCGITRRHIMRGVAKLEEAGLVTVKRSFGIGNRYHLTSVENVTSDKISTTPVTKEVLPPVTKTAPPLVTKTAHRKDQLKRSSEKKSEKINVVVPDSLSVPSFLEAWTKFQQHRMELRKPLTPTAAGSLLKKLAGWGVDRAVAGIEHSIASSWQGIFEPNGTGASRPGHRTQPPTTGEDHAQGF